MKYNTEQAEFSQNGECQQRGFVDLPGFVDLEILSEEAGEGFNVAMPICRCLVLCYNLIFRYYRNSTRRKRSKSPP